MLCMAVGCPVGGSKIMNLLTEIIRGIVKAQPKGTQVRLAPEVYQMLRKEMFLDLNTDFANGFEYCGVYITPAHPSYLRDRRAPARPGSLITGDTPLTSHRVRRPKPRIPL